MAGKSVRRSVMEPVQSEIIVHEPTVSIKVETLFSQVNNKMEQISRDIANLVEMGHKKADKVELEKVESVLSQNVDRVERELRGKINELEKTTATSSAVIDNKNRLEELARSYKMHWISTVAAILLGIGSIIVAVIRH